MPPKRKSMELLASNVTKKLTPKERGCFQCSRRRIVCDKSEPSCGKCIKKGIECSGVNRIRFTEAVARRGKLKDCKIPDASGTESICLPTTTTFPAVRWKNEKRQGTEIAKTSKKQRAQSEAADLQDSARCSDELDGLSPGSLVATNNLPQISAGPDESSEAHDDVEEIVRFEDGVLRQCPVYVGVQPWLAPLSSEARMLFSHFSEAIAPVMVIVDTAANGYREIILPMALEDEVLRRAVGVVAAQHLSRERPDMQQAAEAGRAAIISRLRKDASSATPEQVFNKFTWATLVVLLVGETVTGSADYSFLVQMLLCLSTSRRAEYQRSPVTRFLQTSTNLFELLGLPLLGEHHGMLALQRFSHWEDWLTCEQFPEGSESQRILDEICLCFAAASDIYTRRATSEEAESSRLARLHPHTFDDLNLKNLMERISLIPPCSPGAHALVWPCFVAGAETADPGQRAFFVEYMNSIYARTKFRNIPTAVRSLENIWARKGGKRWTQCLPELSNVLVM
ncbi:hypothetical protein HBI73_035310 [Parastagonospora nodorum]|nr:hypothetical protein HBH61_085160 [Parastagonospora nodorum]KAH5165248.1 hypothetical protein HBI73_035310 [Parastagonospora nodorum]KAH5214144.1 hypothetical protein HBH68_065540 [Parastagonospora nodorum]KAH5535430.1 hypothetical protein HBI27_171460 [Parastagonospora nodorum]KAH6024694.1 hypothetical protein HBI83_064500 [Parastagonospora nodorum]